MSTGMLSGLVTAILLIVFLGGVAWAWSARRGPDFERASRLPLEEDARDPREEERA